MNEDLFVIAKALLGPEVRRDGYGNVFFRGRKVTFDTIRKSL
jgi:hypothetical protein